jgi:transcriptional regulator with XRE-family HTH domain
MSTASEILGQARRGTALTQAKLGRLSGERQGFISRAETGRQDLTVSVLNRLVHASGWRLTLLPTQSGTAADAAQECRAQLKSQSFDGPYRAVVQLADDLAREHGAERVALTVTPPAPTGDHRYDAFIAGVVEHRLGEEDLPVPRWLASAARLESAWYVDPYSVGDQQTVDNTPVALRDRGVIIDAVELASV